MSKNRVIKHEQGITVRGVFYDVNEAARLLRVQPRTINTLVHRGHLNCVKYGNLTFYLQDELEHFLRSRRKTRTPLEAVTSGKN